MASVTDKLKQTFSSLFTRPEPTAPANLVQVETTPLTAKQEAFTAALQPGHIVKQPELTPEEAHRAALVKHSEDFRSGRSRLFIPPAPPRPDMIPVPGQPGKFFIPQAVRVIQLEEAAEVKLRIPLLLRVPTDEEKTAITGALAHVFGAAYWSNAGRLFLRLCSYSRVKLVNVAVPPWEGWRPSWDARFDPGTLDVRRNANAPALSAPLLTLADAYLGGAMAPAEGVTAHCDHCQTEQPRNAQQPNCPKCGGPLRLSAAVAAPTPRAAVKEAPHDLGKLLHPLELCDRDDFFIEIRDTGMPPRPSKRAEYEAWRQDFLCHVELTLMVTRLVGS